MDESTLNNNQEVVQTTLNNNQDVVESTPEINQQPRRDELAELKELNFRQMRESVERERRRNEQLEQELADSRRQSRPQEPDDLDSDDLAEKRQLKKLRDQQRADNERRDKEAQDLREELARIKQQTVQYELASQFPDFKQVVNDRTLEMLKNQDEDTFDTIMHMAKKDSRKACITAYKMIKASVNTKSYDAHDAKIAENKAKPRAAATVPVQESTSPLANFREDGRWKLSAEEAKALRADTARCARNR